MIYGFTGKKRSGKSTASDYLLNRVGGTRLNFKDPLLIEIQANFPEVFHEIRELMDTVAYDGKDWTARRLLTEKPGIMRAFLQNYGTNVRRNDDPEYWTSQWQQEAIKTDGNLIVDDVRFLNEAEKVRELGGVIIVSNDTHISEMEMDKIEADHTISVADGDLDALYSQLSEIIKTYEQK